MRLRQTASSVTKNRQQQLGASYDELEWAMLEAEAGKTADFSGRQKTVFEIYKRLNKTNNTKCKRYQFAQLIGINPQEKISTFIIITKFVVSILYPN
jgi:(p)ppGpp synthase/HD superfamily hydrolase